MLVQFDLFSTVILIYYLKLPRDTLEMKNLSLK